MVTFAPARQIACHSMSNYTSPSLSVMVTIWTQVSYLGIYYFQTKFLFNLTSGRELKAGKEHSMTCPKTRSVDKGSSDLQQLKTGPFGVVDKQKETIG